MGLHLALGIPHPLTAGLDYVTPSRKFAFSLIGGRTGGTVQDYDVDISNLELQLRYHPWATSFFWGLGIGNHVVTVKKTETIQNHSVSAEAEVNAGYVTPQLGWIRIYPSGFTLGFQVGWLLPTSSSTKLDTNAPASVTGTQEYEDFKNDVTDQGDTYGKMGVPYVSLLRLGWVF